MQPQGPHKRFLKNGVEKGRVWCPLILMKILGEKPPAQSKKKRAASRGCWIRREKVAAERPTREKVPGTRGKAHQRRDDENWEAAPWGQPFVFRLGLAKIAPHEPAELIEVVFVFFQVPLFGGGLQELLFFLGGVHFETDRRVPPRAFGPWSMVHARRPGEWQPGSPRAPTQNPARVHSPPPQKGTLRLLKSPFEKLLLLFFFFQ